MINIGVFGYLGSMGTSIQHVCLDDDEVRIIPVLRSTMVPSSSSVKNTLEWYTLETLEQDTIDVLIDFSSPTGMLESLSKCVDLGFPYIGGVTGIGQDILEYAQLCSKKIPLVYASNFSFGITMLKEILPTISALLKEEEFDVEILDIHHRNKKDSPSGTAQLLAEAVAEGRNVQANQVCSLNNIRKRKLRGEIGMASLRGGHVFGEHTLYFLGDNESISITHHANNREVFAKGAVFAAKWIVDREAGMYKFSDILLDGAQNKDM